MAGGLARLNFDDIPPIYNDFIKRVVIAKYKEGVLGEKPSSKSSQPRRDNLVLEMAKAYHPILLYFSKFGGEDDPIINEAI